MAAGAEVGNGQETGQRMLWLVEWQHNAWPVAVLWQSVQPLKAPHKISLALGVGW